MRARHLLPTLALAAHAGAQAFSCAPTEGTSSATADQDWGVPIRRHMHIGPNPPKLRYFS